MSSTESSPVGRPTDYTPELADAICARLADGESLRSICRDETLPAKTTVFRWLREKEEFRDQYTISKDESADSHADDMIDIADDGRNDWMARNDPDNPGFVANGEHIQRSRLRVETRKWIASKLKPKKYGERVAQEISGPDGAPIEIQDARERNLAILKSITNRIAGQSSSESTGGSAEPDVAGGNA